MENDVVSSTIITSKSFDYLTRSDAHFSSVLLSKTPLADARYVMQHHQDLINRNALCVTRLREAAREVESLRLENAALRNSNRELNNHLNFLFQASSSLHKQHYPLPSHHYNSTTSPIEILNHAFHNLCNITGGHEGREEEEAEEEVSEDESPTSVMQVENVDTTSSGERIILPKSISVRSNGYLKTNQASASKTRRNKPPSQLPGAQKVYVRGEGKEEEEPLELEVYNQGMFKTELCNKWQETGTCPYGNNCQFAHGIEELRPVIRHPRYKTEVCRMVLSGDACPYGHRCHFRHVLTDEERLMGQPHNTPIKLLKR